MEEGGGSQISYVVNLRGGAGGGLSAFWLESASP
jgi:hypothetical protein